MTTKPSAYQLIPSVLASPLSLSPEKVNTEPIAPLETEQEKEVFDLLDEELQKLLLDEDLDRIGFLLGQRKFEIQYIQLLSECLFFSLLNNKKKVATFFLQHENLEVNLQDKRGRTAVHFACKGGDVECLVILDENGYDLRREDKSGVQGIHLASAVGNVLSVHFMVCKGANKEAKDVHLRTPLHWAVLHYKPLVVMYLTSSGVQPDVQDENGHSPLHLAAAKGLKDLVSHFLWKGFSFGLRDKKGLLPREIAMENGYKVTAFNLHISELESYERTYGHLKGRPFVTAFVALIPFIISTTFLYFFCTYGILTWYTLLPTFITIVLISYVWPYACPHYYSSPFAAGHMLTMNFYFIACFFYTFFPRIEQFSSLRYLIYVEFALAAINTYCSLKTIMSDPGYVKEPVVVPENIREMLANGLTNENFCCTCMIKKPIRSKHCGFCGKCILRFDHHCPLANNCVGMGTQGSFYGLVTSMALYLAIFVFMFCKYVEAQPQIIPFMTDPLGFLSTTFDTCPWLLIMTFLAPIHLIWGGAMAFTQTKLIWVNMTFNEQVNKSRYGYLIGEGGQFRNPFHRGCVRNFHLRLCSQPDISVPHLSSSTSSLLSSSSNPLSPPSSRHNPSILPL